MLLLLQPGFVYHVALSRRRPWGDPSALLEIARVLFVGMTVSIVAAGSWGLINASSPERVVDLEALLTDSNYLAREFPLVVVNFLVVAGAGVVLAWVAGSTENFEAVRRWIKEHGPPGLRSSADPPHRHGVDPWWLTFHINAGRSPVYARVWLIGGGFVDGFVREFSTGEGPYADRELVLRPLDAPKSRRLLIPGKSIQKIGVVYHDAQSDPPSLDCEWW